jgi:hypothetical protein
MVRIRQACEYSTGMIEASVAKSLPGEKLRVSLSRFYRALHFRQYRVRYYRVSMVLSPVQTALSGTDNKKIGYSEYIVSCAQPLTTGRMTPDGTTVPYVLPDGCWGFGPVCPALQVLGLHNVDNAAFLRKLNICALSPFGTHVPDTCRVMPGTATSRCISSRRSQCRYVHTKRTTSHWCLSVCVLVFSESLVVLL